jgi:hypothetical protein
MNDQTTNLNEAAGRRVEVVLTRKPRCDSPLRQLPEPRQAEVVERLRTNTLAAVRLELAVDGIQVSIPALSQFRIWYLKRMEERTMRVSEMLAEMEAICVVAKGRKVAGVTEAQIAKLTVKYLSIRALANRDSMAWARVHGMRLKGEWLKLQKRRMALQDRFLSLRNRRVQLLEQAEARKQASAARRKAKSTVPHELHTQEQHPTHSPAAGSEGEKQKCAGISTPQPVAPLVQPARDQSATSGAPTGCNPSHSVPRFNEGQKT